MVESQPSKLLVAGSIPVSRSIFAAPISLEGWTGRPASKQKRQEGTQERAAGLSAAARNARADVAQLAERVLGKDEVTSSILVIGSRLRRARSPRRGFVSPCQGAQQRRGNQLK